MMDYGGRSCWTIFEICAMDHEPRPLGQSTPSPDRKMEGLGIIGRKELNE